METLLAFLFVLSVLVFVHEYGHYWVAIKNGVKVEAFSIGFGPELFGWKDKKGTRWKVSLIPLGGYVKMFGDMNPASAGQRDDLNAEEEKYAFHHKGVGARAAIVFAGPLANFVFAIIVFTFLFAAVGQQRALPVVGDVLENSPAASAGLLSDDQVIAINGATVEWFSELSDIVRNHPAQTLAITVLRDGQSLELSVTPDSVTADENGVTQTFGRLGITAGAFDTSRDGVIEAVGRAFETAYSLTTQTFSALGEMVSGDRDSSELGGPIRIAQMSGQVAEGGLGPLLFFMGYLSISLGLINLMPVPVLDGGHLVFYAIEAIRGKPLGAKAQEYGFRIGAGLVFSLIIFATWNDLTQLGVFSFLKGLAG
ncbi:RIP metalloprotease RseP [Thalassospira sp. SM2505]|uniref:Zinc metalloprotease n=1 Tax=Thalassospira profundimaris TaxID=502049 RepID=A0A367X2I7_9PROT|nr:RIP metalloprotease RseP [Thalassospira profundimaris]RCK47270.1 zinc metalloprotease [Thalassospira profundimaris]